MKVCGSSLVIEQLSNQITDGGLIPTLPLHAGKCHQRKIRDEIQEKELNGMLGDYWKDYFKNIDLSKKNALVKEIDRKQAEIIILKYEWLGTLPANYMRYYGLFYSGNLAGVACFTNVKFGGKYSLYNYDCWCLGRGACVYWSPPYAGSFLVSMACKLLIKEPTYVVAYSDWEAGEIGTIYQACNWIYLGHTSTKQWIDKNGRRYDINTPAVRCVSGFQRKKNKELRATKEMIQKEITNMIKEGYRQVDGAIRGRYAMVYGDNNEKKKQMLNVLLKNKKPYPKRNLPIDLKTIKNESIIEIARRKNHDSSELQSHKITPR